MCRKKGSTALGFIGRNCLSWCVQVFRTWRASALYQKILYQADGKPVVFRTLDVGGDKVLPYWSPEPRKTRPWARAIRISLDRPAMLRQHLRALVRAAGGRDLRVMFPMVAEVREFIRAKRHLEKSLTEPRRWANPSRTPYMSA